MTDEARTLADLDAAIRAHAEDLVDDGEVITDWIVVLGTRVFDGGGHVRHILSDDGIPTWQARGMFTESVAKMDRGLARLDRPGDA